MKLRSLRARLLTGVVALSALALVLLSAALYLQQRRFAFDRVENQARSAILPVNRALNEQGVAGGTRRGPAAGDRDGNRAMGPPGSPPPGDARGGVPLLPPDVYGERRSGDGKVLGSVLISYSDGAVSPPNLPKTVTPEQFITVPAEDGSVDYRVFAAESPEGFVTISAVPMSDAQRQLSRLLLTEGLLVAGALGLMGLFGWWVIGYGLKPLDAMATTAGHIAEGDLSKRVTPAEPDTEVGRLGLALNAMLAQIEASFRKQQASEDQLRRFLADASHELRTPLASIRGYAELHRMGASTEPDAIEHSMERIEAESARMGKLVEDLLTLARLDEQREPVREPVMLAALVRDAVSDAEAADSTGRTIGFTVDGPEHQTTVLGDADRLRQVLANLLRNALVHTPAGTPIEVHLARVAAEPRIRLSVRDYGPGIPPESADALFERFWRASPGRERGPAGAGLGLAIVAGIVDAHGGTVRVEQADGGGSRFTVELPALEA